MTLSDERLRQLAAETLELARTGHDGDPSPGPSSSEDRIAALEARVRRLEAALRAAGAAGVSPAPQAVARVALIPLPMVGSTAAHQYGLPPALGERCVLEPGSPCVGHGACKSHGY